MPSMDPGLWARVRAQRHRGASDRMRSGPLPRCSSDRWCRPAVRSRHARNAPSGRSRSKARVMDRQRATVRCTLRSSGSGRPTNTASIGNRMNIMWIPFNSGSQRAEQRNMAARPIKPMNFAHSEPATSSSVARTDPRVTLRTTNRVTESLLGSEILDDQNHRRAEDDDEQRREDASDEREQHLDRRLGRLFLGALGGARCGAAPTGPGAPCTDTPSCSASMIAPMSSSAARPRSAGRCRAGRRVEPCRRGPRSARRTRPTGDP